MLEAMVARAASGGFEEEDRPGMARGKIGGDVTAMNANGLEAVYHRHRTELLRLLCARTGDASEAEDIIQDLWLKARAQQSTGVNNSKAYLYRMAHNLLIDRLRERHRRMSRDHQWATDRAMAATRNGSFGYCVEEDAHDRDEAARLASAVARLPEGARSVFNLHKVQGLSHAEVAARLNISRSGVEKHMAVAMKYLRRQLLN